ncbi:MAG: hypothetical protein A2607_01500 [Candidatus Vogelbacteria bacterium RIFOXYD1_FULL_42_15]|uniref:Outer membrane protein beta-barrel domain-containing protein n=1 Tax=Candidatus Vogelbacteria bacterium RIFOXYD1_FULL_42_15 TaxID=1802437 RepID=A0A1G2QC49_9BACT|nr:MAG: hypothetical protein A2607_01500 [Candidatus Vogelbacteria bacterium RIFOXYD1_FULL_42_15]
MRSFLAFALVFLTSFSAWSGALSPTPGGRTSGTQIGGDQTGPLLSNNLWGYFDKTDKKIEFVVGTEVVKPKFTIKDALGRKQESRNTAHVLPFATGAIKLNDWLAVGLNLDNPFRLGSAYDHNREQWGFDTQSLISLTTASFLADVKVNERLSISFGPVAGMAQIIYRAPLDINRTPLPLETETKASGWGLGGTIGVSWQASERLKFGLQYTSPIEPDIHGHTKIHLGPFKVRDEIGVKNLVFPQTLVLASSWQATRKLQLVGDVCYWNYSQTSNNIQLKFSRLLITKPLALEWRDTVGIHLGANYRLNQDWTLRAGAGWLSQGIPDKRLDTITQDVAGFDLALGVSYKAFSLSWTHAWGSNDVGHGLSRREYGIKIDTFALGGSFKF